MHELISYDTGNIEALKELRYSYRLFSPPPVNTSFLYHIIYQLETTIKFIKLEVEIDAQIDYRIQGILGL